MMLEAHQNPTWEPLLRGPDGRTLPRQFERPAGIYEGELCAATGKRPVGGGEVRRDLLVRGEGPALRCDQLTAEERMDLDWALQDMRRGGRYTGAAVDSINRYAEASGYYNPGRFNGAGLDQGGGPPIVPIGGDPGGGSGGDPGAGGDPVIVPIGEDEDG